MGPKRIDPETPIDCSALHCRLTARACRQRQRYAVGRSKFALSSGNVSRYPSCLPGRCPLGRLVVLALGPLSERIGFYPTKKK